MSKQKEKKFVWHSCKNLSCNNGWMDEDLTNAKSYSPRWKYCQNCCEKYGYINPDAPQKKKLSKKQIETLSKNKFIKKEYMEIEK